MLGLEWIKKTPTQNFAIFFLTKLKDQCNSALITGHKVAQTGILFLSGGHKEDKTIEVAALDKS